MSDIWQLFRIQQIDNQIADIDRKLETDVPGQEIIEELERMRGTLEEKESLLKAKGKDLKNKDFDLQKLMTQRKSFEKKLYGGESGNPKELAGWQQEIDILKKKQGALEEEMLVLMMDIEQLEEELKENRKSIEIKEAEHKKSLDNHGTNQQNLEQDKESLRAKKEKMIESIEAPLMATYRELYDHKDGVAIVKIVKGICGGCFMNLPESTMKKVKRRDLEFCTNCGRILYADGE
jgi:predicted  nucleic acid-binding Zn-ribbon protein